MYFQLDGFSQNTWSNQARIKRQSQYPKSPWYLLSVIPHPQECPLSWFLSPQINFGCPITLYKWNHLIHTVFSLTIFRYYLCLWNSFTLLHVLVVCSFSLCTVSLSLSFCLINISHFIHFTIDGHVGFSSLRLLQILLLLMFIYILFGEHTSSFCRICM